MENMNKSFYERAKELANNCEKIENNQVYKTLSNEFKIEIKIVENRFKSLFGKSVEDYISETNIPSKEAMRDAIIQCDNQKELLNKLNTNSYWIKGLYDKYFGVSTFNSAKAKLFNEMDYVQYNPSPSDNLSILN